MRDRVRPASTLVLVFVLVAAMVAACGSSIASPSPSSGLIVVPTQPPPGGNSPQACMTALLTGVLVADRRWGVAVAPPDGGPVIKVVWPFGFAGEQDAGGVVLVDLSANGATVARVGDRVEIEGGFMSGVDDAWLACGGVAVVADG